MADVSNPDALKQIQSVNKVLEDIGCSERPVLLVLNKVDIIRKVSELEMLQTVFADAVCISAKTGLGLEQLAEVVSARYKGSELLLRVSSSQSNGKVQSFLRAYGKIIKEQYCDSSVQIDARLGRNQLAALKTLRPENIEVVEA
jgi:GTP-binding protein HflX